MAECADLACKIYLEPEQAPEEVAALLAELLTGTVSNGPGSWIVHTRSGELDVRKNKDADNHLAQEYPDGFLHFRYAIEFYPFSTAQEANRAPFTAAILESLWARGVPAVAACDYEGELPNRGGYKNRSLPWPVGAGSPLEARERVNGQAGVSESPVNQAEGCE
jgi:hypothetical protein